MSIDLAIRRIKNEDRGSKIEDRKRRPSILYPRSSILDAHRSGGAYACGCDIGVPVIGGGWLGTGRIGGGVPGGTTVGWVKVPFIGGIIGPMSPPIMGSQQPGAPLSQQALPLPLWLNQRSQNGRRSHESVEQPATKPAAHTKPNTDRRKRTMSAPSLCRNPTGSLNGGAKGFV
jgi:hypothetical protein